MRELFIYYRSPQEMAARVAALAGEFQAALVARHAGLQARLLRRPEPADGMHTWMETYSMNSMTSPEGVNADLEREIAQAARVLAPCLTGPRHIEVFTPCA
jgi:hypothetical protein